jgi:hypothetical protein
MMMDSVQPARGMTPETSSRFDSKVVNISDMQHRRDQRWYEVKTAIGYLEEAAKLLSKKSEIPEVNDALEALKRSRMRLEKRSARRPPKKEGNT